MEQQQSSSFTSTRFRSKRPPLYDVTILNDDFTTMDFVILILESIFNKSTEEAIQLMLYIHNNGEAIVGSYIYDIAHSKADKAKSLAKNYGFPLQITVTQKI